MTVQTIKVGGMTCGHCVAAITSEVSKVPGVQSVVVDLTTGTVTVASTDSVSDAAFAAAIDEAGFEVVRS